MTVKLTPPSDHMTFQGISEGRHTADSGHGSRNGVQENEARLLNHERLHLMGASLHTIKMSKNGKEYALEVVVREKDWTILHFLFK